MKEGKIIFPAGSLQLEGYYAPAGSGRGVVVTHPHPLMGGSLENNVVDTLVKTFFHQGSATLRFNFRGTCTMLTTSGRQTLCALLGEWADALTRANWDMKLGGFFPDGSDKITESKKLDKAG